MEIKQDHKPNLNSQYLVLFKNPRDRQQVAVLARHTYPSKSDYFWNKFEKVIGKTYGYLLVDLNQKIRDSDKLKMHSFEDVPHKLENVGVSKGGKVKPVYQTTTPTCLDCGTLFSRLMTPVGVSGWTKCWALVTICTGSIKTYPAKRCNQIVTSPSTRNC